MFYVNLEIDPPSLDCRFRKVADDVLTKGTAGDDWMRNVDVWNLRGKSSPMDVLAPRLIRRMAGKGYSMGVIDPLYKVITGDENSADQMANFCNQFDKICTELHAAVIYCHHHSKGAQGGKKSMDRASGSGVFARDPDALMDLTELDLTPELKKSLDGKARIRGIERALDRFVPNWKEDVSQDDRLSPSSMLDFAAGRLSWDQSDVMQQLIAEELATSGKLTAWRIEGTLREFASFDPLNLWFNYPVHQGDDSGVLQDIKVDDGTRSARDSWAKKKKEEGEKTAAGYLQALDDLFEDGVTEIDYKELAEYMGKSPDTVKKDLTGAKAKNGKFNPRHSAAFQEAGFVWKRGKISQKDIQKDIQNA